MSQALDMPPTVGRERTWRSGQLFAVAGVTAILLWAYWSTFSSMAHRWLHDAHYSHGFIVPVLAVLVWWVRHREHPLSHLRPSSWGLLLVAGGAALRLIGAYYYLDFFDGLSLLPILLGLIMLYGGWPLARQTAPAVGLLFFMLPLPFPVEGALSAPLQRIGTIVSTFTLQTLGLPAVSEGNIIHIDDLDIGVLEACNGLGMLSAFFAISTAVALVIRRPLEDRIVVFLSAIPIGIAMNLLRLTATGVLYATVNAHFAQVFFHDLAGWLMMPLALATLGLELYALRCLFPYRLSGLGSGA